MREREKKDKNTRNGFLETLLAGPGTSTLFRTLHVQVSSRAWLHVSLLQPLTPTISKMSFHLHFISYEIYAIANSREARLSVTLPTVLASGVRSRLSLEFLSRSSVPIFDVLNEHFRSFNVSCL